MVKNPGSGVSETWVTLFHCFSSLAWRRLTHTPWAVTTRQEVISVQVPAQSMQQTTAIVFTLSFTPILLQAAKLPKAEPANPGFRFWSC